MAPLAPVVPVPLIQTFLFSPLLCIESPMLNYSYRLAPEHPFPAAYDDSLLVAKRVFDQSAVLGIDVERIAISGDSAGKLYENSSF